MMNCPLHNIDPYLYRESMTHPQPTWAAGDHAKYSIAPAEGLLSKEPLVHPPSPHIPSVPLGWNMMPPFPPTDLGPSHTTSNDAHTPAYDGADDGANYIGLSNMDNVVQRNSCSNHCSSLPTIDRQRGSTSTSTIPAKDRTSHDRYHGSSPVPTEDDVPQLTCEWKNCNYAGSFRRTAELMRHVQTKHISPRSFKCWKRECKAKFNRKDNLEEHLRRVH